jgi:crotonobetainyl-CoA:carnitine CoA-transferase CaiB-like acyl-CoA transferase
VTALLAGVRVVELGDEPVALAGKVLADLGAEVVLVEPPGGGRARRVPPLVRAAGGEEVSPHFLFNAAGKRSVTAQLKQAGGAGLVGRLLQNADVVLVSDDDETLRARGLDYTTLHAEHPRLVVTSVTPFGRRGPRRRWQGSDLVAWAASGALVSIGDPDRRPLAPGGNLAYAAGGLNAVAGTVLALRARARSARGQLVDISLQEAVLSVTGESGPWSTLEGAPTGRIGRRRAAAQGLFPTKDGLVELLPFMPGQWDALAGWIHEDLGIEEATMDTFRGPVTARIPFGALIDGWVEQLTGRYTKHDFLYEAQRRGIPCGAVNEPGDLLADPHLDAVDGWVRHDQAGIGPLVWPRAPLRFGGQAMDSGTVPGLGADNEDIWGRELGLTRAQLAALRIEGSI